jgi:phosphoenolpyruvate---glycerone phosphotransferase subunit DhaL
VTATAAMAPKHGRAGWIGERAQGNEDAGATVVAVVFEALAQ